MTDPADAFVNDRPAERQCLEDDCDPGVSSSSVGTFLYDLRALQDIRTRQSCFKVARDNGSVFGSALVDLIKHYVERYCLQHSMGPIHRPVDLTSASISARGISLHLEDIWAIPPLGHGQRHESDAYATDRTMAYMMKIAQSVKARETHWIADTSVVQYFLPRVGFGNGQIENLSTTFTIQKAQEHIRSAWSLLESGGVADGNHFPLVDMPGSTETISLAHNVFGNHWVHVELRICVRHNKGIVVLHDPCRTSRRLGDGRVYALIRDEIPLFARLVSLRPGLQWQNVSWRKEDVIEEACPQQSNSSDCGFFVWLFALLRASGTQVNEQRTVSAAALPQNALGTALRSRVLESVYSDILGKSRAPLQAVQGLSIADALETASPYESSEHCSSPRRTKPLPAAQQASPTQAALPAHKTLSHRRERGKRSYTASQGRSDIAIGAKLTTGQNNAHKQRWTKSEDALLLDRKRAGDSWGIMSQEVSALSDKSPRACRSRYFRVLSQQVAPALRSNDDVEDHVDASTTIENLGEVVEGSVTVFPQSDTTPNSRPGHDIDHRPAPQLHPQLTATEARMFCDVNARFRSVEGEPALSLFTFHTNDVPDFSDLSQTLMDYCRCIDFQSKFCPKAQPESQLQTLEVIVAQSLNDYCSKTDNAIGKMCYSRAAGRRISSPNYFVAVPWSAGEREEYLSQQPFERFKLCGPALDWMWQSYDTPVLPVGVVLAKEVTSGEFLVKLDLSREDYYNNRCKAYRRPVFLIVLPTMVVVTCLATIMGYIDANRNGKPRKKQWYRGSPTVPFTFNTATFLTWDSNFVLARGPRMQHLLLQKLVALYNSAGSTAADSLEQLPTWSEEKKQVIPARGG